MFRRFLFALLAAGVSTSCAASGPKNLSPASTTATTTSTSATHGHEHGREPRHQGDAPLGPYGRLPSLARPFAYSLDFNIDPNLETFSGEATIDLEVLRNTPVLVLHGIDLTVTEAVWTEVGRDGAVKATTITRRESPGSREAEELILRFPNALSPSRGVLRLVYTAPFSPTLGGLYRVREGEKGYAFTQFEATDARRAFPCFDEPGFKVPFSISMRVPKGMLALANTRETERLDEGKTVRYRFAKTPPLPTYLVALAVGDFSVLESKTGVGDGGNIPLRVVTTQGKSALGAEALREAVTLTAKLGDYFGVDYPYDKLDLVAVPNFGAGAMENPGLITFREEVLLVDPQRASARHRRGMTLTLAHELAHQWFGDLVTMRWWDDLWLNEGFASWMESKVTDEVHPASQRFLEDIAGAYGVMDLDAKASARAVREPVRSSADAEDAFDGITYTKGAAVLRMLESFVTPTTFRTGVRDYIRRHAQGNASAADLFDALGRASGKDLAGMAGTFLDRPGVPVVTASAVCAQDKLVSIDLHQRRWLPLGDGRSDSVGDQPWRIPLCLTMAGRTEPYCVEFAQASASVPAPPGPPLACPSWVYPNGTESGYFRTEFTPTVARNLVQALPSLRPENRLGVLSNLWAQVRAGHLQAAVLTELLPAFDREESRPIVQEVVDVLEGLEELVDAGPPRERFQQFAADRLAHQKALYFGPRRPSKGQDQELRPEIFQALGNLAKDASVQRQAEAMTRAWLVTPKAADPDLIGPAVRMASSTAGKDHFEALRRVFQKTTVTDERLLALGGLFAFQDEGLLAEALSMALSNEIRLQDMRYVFRGVRATEKSRAIASAWVKTHWAPLVARAKGRLAESLVGTVGAQCTEEERMATAAFFRAQAESLRGEERAVALRLERLATCTLLRQEMSGPLADALAKAPAAMRGPRAPAKP